MTFAVMLTLLSAHRLGWVSASQAFRTAVVGVTGRVVPFSLIELVLAGCGVIVAHSQTGALDHLGIAPTFGLAIMVMISAAGHFYGADFKPAVSLTFVLSQHSS
jgi:hypothetical protein